MIAKLFGKIIYKKRMALKISQEKLAEKSNLHRTYISLLERGLRQPTLDATFKIAKALQIKPHLLIKLLEESYENN